MTRFLPTILIIVLMIGFRLLGSALPESLPNFQPVSALFFCGAIMAIGWRGWTIPFFVWFSTYPAPAFFERNFHYLTPSAFFLSLFTFSLIFFMGKALAKKPTPLFLFGSVLAALAFHIITNGVAWMTSPLYVKTFHGLWQSLWLGPEGSPVPSWIFLRNMAAANLVFTTIFLSARFSLSPLFRKYTALLAR